MAANLALKQAACLVEVTAASSAVESAACSIGQSVEQWIDSAERSFENKDTLKQEDIDIS